jgi:hypothetical protein
VAPRAPLPLAGRGWGWGETRQSLLGGSPTSAGLPSPPPGFPHEGEGTPRASGARISPSPDGEGLGVGEIPTSPGSDPWAIPTPGARSVAGRACPSMARMAWRRRSRTSALGSGTASGCSPFRPWR